ncbi:GDSL-type esterase/lipase family protein [Domibacillus iocasae]|uniref:GDSL family lipase n=1 Tax=Domibacillus iocasae TaxID=1714016 RepID=A0A1E7DN83_9BACI|nr:GDSL-type esterase/lipase family protein [Domibacillus iocasae]OES44550.1 GDSL family lipase [Domibacillus iocasae]
MKRVMAGIALAMMLAGCADEVQETAAPSIPQNVDIVSIGDSLTQGVGDSTNSGGYVPYLEEQLESLDEIKDASFVNYGKRGNRTDQLIKRLEQEEIQADIKKADIVMITIGGNDVVKVVKENWSHLTVDTFEKEEDGYAERIQTVLETVRAINEDAGIVLVGIYNPFGRIFVDTDDDELIVRTWNERADEVAASMDRTIFVNVETIFGEGSDGLFFEDQFHPNDIGYEQMAGRIFDTINGDPLEELTNNKIVFPNEGSN